MKRYIILITILCTVIYSASAQLSQGFRAGMGITNLSGDDVSANDFLSVFSGGYFFNYEVVPMFSVQSEINLASKGANHDMILKGFPFSKISLTYIQVPLLLKFSAREMANGIKPSFFVGPAIDFYIVQDADGEMIETDPNNTRYSLVQDPKSITGDLIVGLSTIINDKYIVDLRYEKGFGNVYENVAAKSWGLSLSIGVLLFSER